MYCFSGKAVQYLLLLQQLMNAIVMVHKMQRLALSSSSMDVDSLPAAPRTPSTALTGAAATADTKATTTAAADDGDDEVAASGCSSCKINKSPRESDGKLKKTRIIQQQGDRTNLFRHPNAADNEHVIT